MPSEQDSAVYSDDAIWAVLRIDAVVSVVAAAVAPFVLEGGVGSAMMIGVLVANIAVLAGVAVFGVGSAVWETVAMGDPEMEESDEDETATETPGEPERMAA